MSAVRPITKIFLGGGDPEETAHIRNRLGFLDGQTTNPTFVAKKPEVQKMIASGRKLTREEQNEEYKAIVQRISPLVDTAGVSIEVFADFDTSAEQMVAQGEQMFTWIPNAYIKYPCMREGLRAAKMSVERGMRVNMTLCFSQEQAAAVYAATRGAKEQVYVSPFVGRLDDRGDDGMGLVANIKKMYRKGDGHVHVLAASFRKLEHLLYGFALGAELATSTAKILEQWADAGFSLPDQNFRYEAVDGQGKTLCPIAVKEIDLNASWESFDLKHELTDKGIKRFVDDYKSTLKSAA
ncbi:MAG TPA: transaldolase family protein [Terriglobales bacterium]|nr:transaldolase family protein [Terriglobales bacterium]